MKKIYLIVAAVPILGLVVYTAAGKRINSQAKSNAIKAPAEETTVAAAEEIPVTVPEKKTLPEKDLSEFDTLDFFKDVVYCGDSCMNFYQWNGNSSVKPEIFGKRDAKAWFASNSYAVRYAVVDVSNLSDTEKTYVPKYNGSPSNICDVLPTLGKKRVFMFFGLNDIGPSGVDGFISNYTVLVKKLEGLMPDAKFYIMSVTPMREEKQVPGKLCTENIIKSNEGLVKMCAENGWTYVDVASKLCDENGHLLPELPDGTKLSDGTNVHLTKGAYAFWDEALENLAREELRKEYYEGNK